jgi:hypothetical protein
MSSITKPKSTRKPSENSKKSKRKLRNYQFS